MNEINVVGQLKTSWRSSLKHMQDRAVNFVHEEKFQGALDHPSLL
jgi:hypothetical protein